MAADNATPIEAADPAIDALCSDAAAVAYAITKRIEGARQSAHGEEGQRELRDALKRLCDAGLRFERIATGRAPWPGPPRLTLAVDNTKRPGNTLP